jgi:hypothetical protein
MGFFVLAQGYSGKNYLHWRAIVYSILSTRCSSIILDSYIQNYTLPTGILTAFLASPSVPIPINSVDDLVNQEEMGWGIEAGSIMEQIGSTAAERTIFRWHITTLKMKQFS